jgi:hypothetical protein
MTMMITQTLIIVNIPNGPNAAVLEHQQVRTKATAWRDVAHFPANRCHRRGVPQGTDASGQFAQMSFA